MFNFQNMINSNVRQQFQLQMNEKYANNAAAQD